MKMRRPWPARIILAAALLWLPGAPRADDIKDAITEALRAYEAGEYTTAAGQLDYAAQLVRQLKGGRLEAFLPQPVAGWTGSKTEMNATSMFGGGTSVERAYTKLDSRITVQIIGDAPMLQGLLMMFGNPAMLQGNAKLQTIKGQRAIVQMEPNGTDGELSIVVGQRFLVKINGNRVSRDDLIAFAQTIDYEGLAKTN